MTRTRVEAGPADVAAAAARGSTLLLAFDFDGTLSPTVARPESAELPDRTRRVLARLVGMPACRVAIVSGRGLDDLRTRVEVPGVMLAGSSGLEWDIDGVRGRVPEAAAGAETIMSLADMLSAEVARLPGVWLECKPLGLTVHHRDAGTEAIAFVRARAAELQAADGAGLRVVACALGVEITPCPTHDKSSMVRMLLAAMRSETVRVVYAGNDANDAEAMAEVSRCGGWTIGVGPDAPPSDQRLACPERLADWLEALAGVLPPGPVMTGCCIS